jgi:hypothetical protein
MVERLLEEAFDTGLMVHECPDFEGCLDMQRHLVGILYMAGLDSRGDFYRKALNL